MLLQLVFVMRCCKRCDGMGMGALSSHLSTLVLLSHILIHRSCDDAAQLLGL